MAWAQDGPLLSLVFIVGALLDPWAMKNSLKEQSSCVLQLLEDWRTYGSIRRIRGNIQPVAANNPMQIVRRILSARSAETGLI